jgi:UDP-glucuronate decarboxylase
MADTPHAVVTGGAGFLGSHLVDALLEDGYRVTSLDNYGSGRPANLEHVDSDRFECRAHDVRDPIPDFDRIDHLYHFASRASPDDFRPHAVEIALTNSVGANNVFEAAREHDARVVLASTSEVYGDPEVHPQHEAYTGNVNVRGPRAPYDESKRFAEALAVAYDQQHGVDVRTVRIFNTYGPRMRPDDGRVIPNFLTQAIRGEDLTVYGDGTQTRSFCYVSDLVRGVRTYAELPPGEAAGEVLNLGSEHEITILELAETVRDVVDTDSEIVHRDLPTDDPEVRRPDTTKSRELLEWEPATELREGLERTQEHFRDAIAAETPDLTE